MKILRKILIVLAFLIDILLISFLFYVGNYYSAETVDSYLKSDSRVTVEYKDNDIYFIPQTNVKEEGLIFYSGALVEKEAYAPIMSRLAHKGYKTVLVDMPFKLAIFGVNEANRVFSEDSTTKWYIGGHSLGGAMASEYFYNHNDKLNGLVLLASYSTRDLTDLANNYVLSVFGSNDKVLSMDKYNEFYPYIKSNLYEFEIKGANHAGFASYGEQKGDGEASIKQSVQWDLTTNYIAKFMSHSF